MWKKLKYIVGILLALFVSKFAATMFTGALDLRGHNAERGAETLREPARGQGLKACIDSGTSKEQCFKQVGITQPAQEKIQQNSEAFWSCFFGENPSALGLPPAKIAEEAVIAAESFCSVEYKALVTAAGDAVGAPFTETQKAISSPQLVLTAETIEKELNAFKR